MVDFVRAVVAQVAPGVGLVIVAFFLPGREVLTDKRTVELLVVAVMVITLLRVPVLDVESPSSKCDLTELVQEKAQD